MGEKAQWYVIHTYSGYENKVATSIETIVDLRNLHDQILEVKIPMTTIKEIKESTGELVEVERKLFPGYVLIRMIVNDDTWILIRNIRGVTGFVGTEGKPIPLTDEELARLNFVQEDVQAPFNSGDTVRVVSGPFTGFTGVVDDVDMSAGKVHVMVSMGGRDIPTEMDIAQVSLL